MNASGIKHIFNATKYSLAGLAVLLREQAARHEIILSLGSFSLIFILDGKFIDYLVVAVLFCLVLSIETLNTAIEALVDKLSPERSDFARDAKDLGSLAVFFILIAIGIYLAAVLARAMNWVVW